jgi:hypothetical protein
MKTKHKSCKATTRSGRKCSRLCKKEGMCVQHHKIFKSSKSKSLSPKIYIYYTLDNGGRPFKLDISENNTVSIYELNIEESDKQQKDIYEEKAFKTYKPKKIFIGKSIVNEMTEFSGAIDNSKWDGNSILLEINEKTLEYVYIGATIYSFTAYAKIIEYVSPIGNSSVSYPYAVDELGNYYLMIEDIVLEKKDEIKKKIQEKSDPYKYYYDNSYMKGFENNEKLKIGDGKYTFMFETEDFDKMKKRFNNAQISIIKNDGSEEIVNKETYKALMDRFAKFKGFKPFLNKIMIRERL